MYGTQAGKRTIAGAKEFENDVNMYGTQAIFASSFADRGLRMM